MAAQPSWRSRLTTADLVGYMSKGCKPREKWGIGTEHEKLGFTTTAPHRRLEYSTIAELLRRSGKANGWSEILESGQVIGLQGEGASVTLEPGGQLELSGAPVRDLFQTEAEVERHLSLLGRLSKEQDADFLALGFDPVTSNDDVPRMPKARYVFMAGYMPTVGTRGHDMMFRSTTVQVNLDYSSEEDMVAKFRTSLALQPVAGALFSSSPFEHGRPSGWQSTRLRAWLDTDGDRCGRLPFVFEPGFGFERYAEWALDVPMYFVKRRGEYVPAPGVTFREFMEDSRRVRGLPEDAGAATLDDWELHLTTVFPDVRLKSFLEMRGADCGDENMVIALPALWVGLLYDANALAEAQELVADWTPAELDQLSREAPKHALRTPFRGGTLLDVARRTVDIAERGLRARGLGEEVFLAPLRRIADAGRTISDDLLDLYSGEWKGDITKLFEDPRYRTWQPSAERDARIARAAAPNGARPDAAGEAA